MGLGLNPNRDYWTVLGRLRDCFGPCPTLSETALSLGRKAGKAEIHRCIHIGSDRTFNPLVLGSSPSSLT